jgi:26S proteasome regulatory subunit N6
MPSTSELLAQAASLTSTNPSRAENLYKQILNDTAGEDIVQCSAIEF